MNQKTNGLSAVNLRELMAKRDDICISIYIPTHQAGADTLQNAIRFKNIVRDVARRLEDNGLKSSDVNRKLAPAHDLLQDERFWQYQSQGLAVFLNADLFEYYKIPAHVDELIVITDRFHVKPLLPLLSQDDKFYVLSISQGNLSLFSGNRYSLEEVELSDVPTSLVEALREDDPERQLQFHTATPPNRAGRNAVFHGHGVVADKQMKDDILRFFHQVDPPLKKYLNGSAPLVLAGVEYLFPIYREANSYPHLVDEGIQGNAQRMSVRELHEQAWKIIEQRLHKKIDDAAEKYHELKGTGLTANTIEEIVPAAYYGRIETLFVPLGVQQWGRFDEETGEVALHEKSLPTDEDMLDLAAIFTRTNSGHVLVVKPDEIPDDAPLAAIFRY